MTKYTEFVKAHIHSAPGNSPKERMRHVAELWKKQKKRGSGISQDESEDEYQEYHEQQDEPMTGSGMIGGALQNKYAAFIKKYYHKAPGKTQQEKIKWLAQKYVKKEGKGMSGGQQHNSQISFQGPPPEWFDPEEFGKDPDAYMQAHKAEFEAANPTLGPIQSFNEKEARAAAKKGGCRRCHKRGRGYNSAGDIVALQDSNQIPVKRRKTLGMGMGDTLTFSGGDMKEIASFKGGRLRRRRHRRHGHGFFDKLKGVTRKALDFGKKAFDVGKKIYNNETVRQVARAAVPVLEQKSSTFRKLADKAREYEPRARQIYDKVQEYGPRALEYAENFAGKGHRRRHRRRGGLLRGAGRGGHRRCSNNTGLSIPSYLRPRGRGMVHLHPLGSSTMLSNTGSGILTKILPLAGAFL